MSPEYAMDGLYSIKSDVFSFGVLVLEIMSGKKNTGFYNSDSLNLLRYAWELPTDRPTMPDVVLMISNEHAPLPTPKQPAFTRGRNVIDTNSTIDSAENCSKNSVTISTMEAR
ncbi:hypothetical protein SLA2020_366560 [Shorea laevis]